MIRKVCCCLMMALAVAASGAGVGGVDGMVSARPALTAGVMGDSLQTPVSVEKKGGGGLLGGVVRLLNRLTATDPRYVRPNYYHCAAMGALRWDYSFFRVSGTNEQDNKAQSMYFAPDSYMRIGPYLGYSFVFLGYFVNLGVGEDAFGNSDINFSLYTPLIGIDYMREDNNNRYKIRSVSNFGNGIEERVKGCRFPGLTTSMENLHVYYIFNHKTFSYTAAYSQSSQQLRSSGSFMLGFNYTSQSLHFNYMQLPDLLLYDRDGNMALCEAFKVDKISFRDYSMSFGYSYNWAFAKNMLFNITMTPTLGYNINRGDRFSLESSLFNRSQLTLDLISRSALVWNTGKFYAGISGMAHTYSYHKDQFSIMKGLVSGMAYVGLNFWRKKSAPRRQ